MAERINRQEYMARLIEYKGKDVVKIVTGIRLCGKSILLDLFEDHLLENGVPSENIVHINLESLQYGELNDYLPFYQYVSGKITKGQKNCLSEEPSP